jgi:hypothetical protein
MKKRLFHLSNFFLAFFFLFFGCGNEDASTKEHLSVTNTESKKETGSSTVSNDQQNGIVGEWEQQYTCFDKNGNYKLEPEEKQPTNTRTGFDWFRFNADGSCLRDKEIKFKSTYEIQKKSNSQELVIHNVHGYTIVELTEKELILGAEGAFIVFKKIN